MNNLLKFMFIALNISMFPKYCHCEIPECIEKSISSNSALICTNKNLTVFPSGITDNIKHLDLSNNQFHNLDKDVFNHVDLTNLKILILKNCSIHTLDKMTFTDLKSITEINLSNNKITVLHSETFDRNDNLINLYLNDNLIERLNDGLFKNLKNLLIVDLNNNKIHKIESRTFDNLSNLKTLKITGNRLSSLQKDVIDKLKSLKTFDLNGNPWTCDCNLRAFATIIADRKLYTDSPSCASPQKLLNQTFSQLDTDKFACKPFMFEPAETIYTHITGDTVTLSCRAKGDPSPKIEWVKNSTTIINNSNNGRYVIRENNIESTKWTNLSISSINLEDLGNFTCFARNSGGEDERNVQLIIKHKPLVIFTGSTSKMFFLLFIGTSCLGLLFILIFFVRYCIKTTKKNNEYQSIKINSDIITQNPIKFTTSADILNNFPENKSMSVTDIPLKNIQYPRDDPLNELMQNTETYNPSRNEYVIATMRSNPLAKDQLSLTTLKRLSSVTSNNSDIYSNPSLPNRQQFNYKPAYNRRFSTASSQASYMTLPIGHTEPEPIYDRLGMRTSAKGSSNLSINRVGLQQSGRTSPTLSICSQATLPISAARKTKQVFDPRLYQNINEFQHHREDPSRNYSSLPTQNSLQHHYRKFPPTNNYIYDTTSANNALQLNHLNHPPQPRAIQGNIIENDYENGIIV